MTQQTGPIPLSSDEYVERKFENEAISLLLNREWVLILGPRQHGKTSAFIRMQASLKESGFRCAFVDLQSLPPKLSFEELLRWFGREVAESLDGHLGDVPAERRDQLEAWLEAAIPTEGPPVVILVDEVSGVRDEEIRNSFFGQIRALKTRGARAKVGALVGKLQFAFAGTFRVESLVTDQNSPFNVSRRVETEDITLEGIEELARGVLPDAQQAEPVASAIFDEVGGQPHLVQHLLGIAESAGSGSEVAAITGELDRLKIEGSDHLDGMFRLVFEDVALMKLATSAAAAGFVENDAANPDSRYMIAVGLMRRDGPRLVFRNALYEAVAKASPQIRPEAAANQQPAQHLISISEDAFQFIIDDELREIATAAHNGAVSCYNAGSYRLAMIGFGVALEAMLIAWLGQQQVPALAAAVTAAKSVNGADRARFINNENETAPLTWRLVNLMKVGRAIGGVRGPMDVPDALRDMRNYVHPAVMKAAYIAEVDLQPEALASGALFSAVKRDLTP